MSLQKATLLACFVATLAQPESNQQQSDHSAPSETIFNETMGLDDAPSATPVAIESNPQSPIPTSLPSTKSEFCLNTPGWVFGTSVKYTCDEDFVWCSDPGASENCCKCKPECCGLCKTRNYHQDMYQPCYFEPTLWPTSIHDMQNLNAQETGSTNNKNDQTDLGLIVGISALGVFLLVTIMVRINIRQRQEILSLRRRMVERRRYPSARNAVEVCSSSREKRIRRSFFFDTVLPDTSNANATSLRSLHDAVDGNVESSEQTKDHKKKKSKPQHFTSISDRRKSLSSKKHSSSSRSISSQKRTQSIGNMFSSWRKQADTGECSICLEPYKPGEMICIAKAEACNHVFHKECLVEWLKTKDCCPLCRVNLLVPPE